MKSVIILCGGLSTRMGRDKGSMNYNNEPMIVHVLKTVKIVADEIILVLRDYKQSQAYKHILDNHQQLDIDGLKICTDLFRDQGPLVGILTGLKQISSEKAMVVPCDSPFISDSFLSKLFEISDEDADHDAYIPQWSNGKLEPLHSIYPKCSVTLIEKLLENDIRDVKTLISHLTVKYVDIQKIDVTGKSFLNLNSNEDISNLNR